MSFDLAVWFEVEPITAAAAQAKYERLCEEDFAGLVADERVDAFYRALTTRYPEIDTVTEVDLERCPWSCGMDRSGGHVLMAIVWSRAAELKAVVRGLAAEHGLVCFDPQAGVVHSPVRPAVSGVLRLELCDGSVVDGPDLVTIRREVGRLSAANWYVVLEGPRQWYVQAGFGRQAGVSAGQYALERREGSAERHYRRVVASLDDVLAVFEGFASGGEGWKQHVEWQRVNL